MLAGVRPGGQFAFHRGLRQHVRIRYQRVYRVDAGVQVVLDGVEIAVVVVGDPGAESRPCEILST